MAAGSDVITIEILGTRLQLRGGENPRAVERAGELVRARVEELAQKAPSAPSLQLALLTAINLADEYLQLYEESRLMDDAIDKANRILVKTGGAATSPRTSR